MQTVDEFIAFIESDDFDVGNKWAIHYLIRDLLVRVENRHIDLEGQGQVLDALYKKLGWRKSKNSN